MDANSSRNKRRVTEIPYNSSDSEVIYEVIDEGRQKDWEVTEVKRDANAEISRFPKHSHIWLELIIPLKGSAEVLIRNERHIVNPGEMLIIPPLVIHESRRYDFNQEYHGMVVHYFYQHLLDMINNTGSLVFDQNPVPFEQKWTDHLFTVFRLLEKKDPLYRLRSSLLMDELLLYITENYGHWEKNGLGDSQITLVRNAITSIEETAFKNQCIQAVAENLHVSYAYLSRCFRKETGITMSEYRDTIRMVKAADLVRKTDMPLEAISMEVGYGEYAPFSRRFKNYYGITASSMRKTRHNKSD